jgi:outer membrane protein assembly factor BamB
MKRLTLESSIPLSKTRQAFVAIPSIVVTMAFLAFLAAHFASPTLAAVGDLVWTDRVDLGGPTPLSGTGDFPRALVAAAGRVFAAGFITTAAGRVDLVVRAYDARTGVLIWQDIFNGGGFDLAFTMTADNNRVFVGGRTSIPGSADQGLVALLVRAYDVKTGRVLWSRVSETLGGFEDVSRLSVVGSKLFLAGVVGGPGPDGADFYVAALDPSTGDVIWSDRVDKGGYDAATSLIVNRNRLIAVGWGSGFRQFIVRAYDLNNGALAWENVIESGGVFDIASGVAAHGDRVFVAGANRLGDIDDTPPVFNFLVRSFDANTGELLWTNARAFSGPAQPSEIVVHANQLFVCGWASPPGHHPSYLVRAYDGRTGAVRWEDQLVEGGKYGYATACTLSGQRLLVAGSRGGIDNDNFDWIVRAYDAASGAIRWETEFNAVRDDEVMDMVFSDGLAIVGGASQNVRGDYDWLIRAYDAK